MGTCRALVLFMLALLTSSCGKMSAPPDPIPTGQSVDLASKADVVVYNADLSPQFGLLDGDPPRPILRAAQETRLRFGLGPRWSQSVVPPVPVNPEITAAKTNVPLTVVAVCDFCEPGGNRMQSVVYRPSSSSSDIVVFTLLPKRPKSGESHYEGKLQLLVMNNVTGREYDRIGFEVAVVQEDRALTASTPVAMTLGGPVKEREADTDAILYVVEEQGKGVTVALNPIDPALRESLKDFVFDTAGNPRKFPTGDFSEDQIKKLTGGAFAEVSSISLQGRLAADMRHAGGGAIVSENSQRTLVLTQKESADVSGVLAKYGQMLYTGLFLLGPSPDDRKALLSAISRLEAAAQSAPANRPLRLRVVTDRLQLPWQYLLPTGRAIAATQFWGMLFSLTTSRVATPAPVVPSAAGNATRTVFARYGTSTDPSVPYAVKQIAQLRSLPVNDLLVVDSREALLSEALDADRDKVAVIVAFLHASSGQSVTPGVSTSATSMTAEGPGLYFSANDFLRADSLLALRTKLTPIEIVANPRYLGGGPLVILNACETGPSTLEVPFVTLNDALFALGAQAVIVTEVAVWANLGHEVSTRLFARLGQGQKANDALTQVRREMYKQFNNPLGLLYAYYGDPEAVLRR